LKAAFEISARKPKSTPLISGIIAKSVATPLPNSFPDFDFWEGRAQCIHSLHQRLNLGTLQMGIEGGFGRPILVEQEFRRIVGLPGADRNLSNRLPFA